MSEYLQFGASILASDDLAVGRVANGASLDGRTILDAFLPFGADNSVVYERGAEPRVYALQVWRFFATLEAAKGFMLTHPDTLPRQADLTLVSGSSAWTMADAVASARMVERRGVAVLVAYTFTGAKFASDAVPEAPDDSSTVKAINQALTMGTVSQAIAYDVAFGAAPRGITLQLSAPDGGAIFGWQIRESSRTALGFTVDFDAAVPAAGYKLTGIAVL